MEIGIHLAQDAFYLIDLSPDRRAALLGFLRAKMRKSGKSTHQRVARQVHTGDMITAFREQGATEKQISNFMRGIQWEAR